MSSDEYALPATITRYFNLAAAPYAATAQDIAARRAASPDGKLFFDRLLAFADIDGSLLYPPTSPADFRRLLHAIHSTTRIDRLKRDSFVYYLVKDEEAEKPAANGAMDVDESGSSDDGESSAAQFARRRCLPRTWRVFMDGYWALDHGRWDDAVAALSDPCISELNFVPEIVAALTTLVSPPAHSMRLVFSLLDTRTITGKEEADAKLLATTSVAGMSAAFQLLRGEPDASARAAGREAVWCWSLGAPRTPSGRGDHTAQPQALRELLHLPMNDEESAHLVRFLAHPPREIAPPARSLLHDLVTLRLVHEGKYEETLALDKELAGTDATSAADRQRRREMVREFIDILPEAQRRILLGEDYKRGAAAANGTLNGGDDVDMSSSWVQVDKEDGTGQRSKSPTRPSAASAPTAPATPIAPKPVRPAQRALGLDGTPARNGASSPFGGPPRFASPRPKADSTAAASTAAASSTTPSRQASPTKRAPSPPAVPARLPSPTRPSTSPFVQPKTPAAKPARRSRRVINDDQPLRRSSRTRSEPPEDDDDALSPAGAHAAGPASIREPSEPPIPEDEPAPPVRRVRRTAAKKDKADDATQATPRARPARRTAGRSSRASTAEPAPSPPASVAGSQMDDDDELKIPGAFGDTPARHTRSASRAALDEPVDERNPPPAKRTRARTASRKVRAPSEAASEVSEAPSATPVRRSRRTAASDRGSPTPSIASTAGGSPRKRTSTRATRSRKKE